MYQAQQYYFDTAEVEAWLSEQELHMMNEEKGKVGGKGSRPLSKAPDFESFRWTLPLHIAD